MLDAQAIKSKFASKHIPISEDWLEQCLDWVRSEFPDVSDTDALTLIYQEWLNLDLRDVQLPVLPRNINTAIETKLNETIHLQLLYVVDISKPKYLQLKSIRSKFDDHTEDEKSCGMLKLQLTDGVQEISAIEYKKVPDLNLNLEPGLKICFKPPINIRRGQIMLEPYMVELRGGCVPEIQISNCVENILAAALKQVLNNNPKNGHCENVTNPVVPDSERTSVTLTNLTNTIDLTRTNGHVDENRRENFANPNPNPNPNPNEFDDIINDVFFEQHLDALESNNMQRKSSFATDEEDWLFARQNEEFLTLPGNHSNQSENNSRRTESHSTVVVSPEVVPEATVTAPIKRPIMKIAKLQQMKHKVTKGLFKIEMQIDSILEKLQVKDSCYSMKVLAVDDSGEMEVKMGNQVMKDLVEIEPDAFIELFSNDDPLQKTKVATIVHNLTEKVNSFCAHVVLSIEVNKDPVVIEVLETFPLE